MEQAQVKTQAELGYPRLRELYAMMAGIPEEVVKLDAWKMEKSGQSCGMNACIGGWACTYPAFSEQGLKLDRYGIPRFGHHGSFSAVGEFFGVHDVFSESMFDVRGQGHERLYLDRMQVRSMSDKKLALWRIRNWLLRNGAITAERNRELALEDGAPE